MNLWSLWGKTQIVEGSDTKRLHPLLCHMIDVAEVAGALWDHCLGQGMRHAVSDKLQLDEATCRSTLMFWAALHDLGKACPAFQRKYKPAMPVLETQGLAFRKQFGPSTCYHGVVTARALPALLEKRLGFSHGAAQSVSEALGGHHGTWPSSGAVQSLSRKQLGDAAWEAAREQLFEALLALYPMPTHMTLGEDRARVQALLTMLSGFVSVADWIGSIEGYFPAVPCPESPERYAAQAASQALSALDALHWTGWHPPEVPTSFKHLFGWTPHPMQQTVIDLAADLREPGLAIIEAPTGSGKTEAALYLADHWARVCQQRGMYVAMPTMATSNQMYERVSAALETRYPDGSAQPLLVHSQARWITSPPALHLETEAPDAGPGHDAAIMSWFLPRKRSLLAPFGVGTVDQALLSVLQTRHFFVRLFALAHKTIIFDEVHAYDTYMSALFTRLLCWLRAMGTSVILLSATLPNTTRRAFLKAYGVAGDALPDEPTYPALTWATGVKSGCRPLPKPPDKPLGIEWIDGTTDSLTVQLEQKLAEGGCAAIICNTVGRAQKVYKALKTARIVPQEDLILFHARYPYAWRQEIERRVLNCFDKEGKDRPHKAIVVATQVIEQSLDLDFDLMVSDLAPVDLILQRAGRLHRHEREQRPSPLRTPHLLLVRPEEKDGLPDYGADAYIYAPYILLRSYLALRDRQEIVLPRDTQALIESVYGEESETQDLSPAILDALEAHRERLRKHRHGDIYTAEQKLVAPPQAEELMYASRLGLEEDKPEMHHTMQALTRLGPPGVSVVCLHRTKAGLAVDPEGEQRVDLCQKPSAELTAILVRHTLNMTHYRIFKYFIEWDVSVGWRKHSLLRTHRVAIFSQGVCPLEGIPYHLCLSRELGLEIVKEVG